MRELLDMEASPLTRRTLLRSAAGTLAAAGAATTLAWPRDASGNGNHHHHGPVPLPAPIPGGLPVGPTGIIHVFLPGPPTVTLPFTGSVLQGLDVEPSTITNFRGATALAFLLGTATGSDGNEYNLEVDIRAFEGTYIAGDGSTNRAAFALI
ncbi:MAG: hypothetical protein GEU99_03490 [Luteitalea sp.]|nr:hypothetical protein [Luteitalea sp.]